LEKGTKNPLDTKQAELESYLRKPQKNLENRFNNRPVGFRKHSEEQSDMLASLPLQMQESVRFGYHYFIAR